MRYERKPEHDRRIRRGDDFAGDAWRDTKTGRIVYGAVGVDRNRQESLEEERAGQLSKSNDARALKCAEKVTASRSKIRAD